jgi:hypothetical protein
MNGIYSKKKKKNSLITILTYFIFDGSVSFYYSLETEMSHVMVNNIFASNGINNII